jgi:hypothetical protein
VTYRVSGGRIGITFDIVRPSLAWR